MLEMSGTLSRANRWVRIAALVPALIPITFAAVAIYSADAGLAASQDPPVYPHQEPEVCSPEWLATVESLASHSGSRSAPVEALSRIDLERLGIKPAGMDSLLGNVQSVAPPNDTYFISHQRNIWMIGALDAWEVSYGGRDATIAVISSGVDIEHPDLSSKIWRNPGEIAGNGLDDDRNGYVDDVIGYDFAEDDADPRDFAVGMRGTWLAGIVAAATNNGQGIAGITWHGRLMPLKVLREYELDGGQKVAGGEESDIVEAVCYAADNGADVVLIAPTLHDTSEKNPTIDRMRAAIDYAHNAGAIVVAAAGDCGGDPSSDGRVWCPSADMPSYPPGTGTNPVMYPAQFPYVIGVQSVDLNLQLRTEASWGPWVDITAPGEDFYTTDFGGDYALVRFYEPKRGGTRAVSDFAAAHVAGVAAVMRSVDPYVTHHRVLEALCLNAKTPPGVEFDETSEGWRHNDHYGCGFLDFEHAIEGMPWRVHDVRPAALTVLTDGDIPELVHGFKNFYLNDGAWTLYSTKNWLGSEGVGQKPGSASRVKLVTDIDVLKQETPRIVGMTFTDTLLACPVGSVNAANRGYCRDDCLDQRCPCQCIDYQLRVIEKAARVYLPNLSRER